MQIFNSTPETINEIEYKMAGIYSAIYSVNEALKENNINNEITNIIINLMFKDYDTLEKYLTDKGVIQNGKN